MCLDSAGSGGSVEGKPAESDSRKMLLLSPDFPGMTLSMMDQLIWSVDDDDDDDGGGGGVPGVHF